MLAGMWVDREVARETARLYVSTVNIYWYVHRLVCRPADNSKIKSAHEPAGAVGQWASRFANMFANRPVSREVGRCVVGKHV